jgi:CheY-like chemotaxis protein
LTVLVVDDDPAMCATLRGFLEREDVTVIARFGGNDALEALEREHVDAVVVDKEMPEMNGLEVVARARRRWPELPIVVITAFGGPSAQAAARARGATAYLEKPFRVTELLGVLRDLTAR